MDTMRDLIKKYPLGYEGYQREKALAANMQAVGANAATVVEPSDTSATDGPETQPQLSGVSEVVAS